MSLVNIEKMKENGEIQEKLFHLSVSDKLSSIKDSLFPQQKKEEIIGSTGVLGDSKSLENKNIKTINLFGETTVS
jgi:hypothetical protein